MVARRRISSGPFGSLKTISTILGELENIKSAGNAVPRVHAIRAQAKQTKEDVEAFLTKIEKYKTTLGAQSRKGF